MYRANEYIKYFRFKGKFSKSVADIVRYYYTTYEF